jgi:hypothetical protein
MTKHDSRELLVGATGLAAANFHHKRLDGGVLSVVIRVHAPRELVADVRPQIVARLSHSKALCRYRDGRRAKMRRENAAERSSRRG